MRWATAAAVLLLTIPPALAGDATTGLSLACPWEDGFATCIKRWSSLAPSSARVALDRCKNDDAIDNCARSALEKAGIRVLERAAVESERERQLAAWAAQRSAREEPAIRQHRQAADARAAEQAARHAADEAGAAQSKAEVDRLLVALQPASRAPAEPWWAQHSN